MALKDYLDKETRNFLLIFAALAIFLVFIFPRLEPYLLTADFSKPLNQILPETSGQAVYNTPIPVTLEDKDYIVQDYGPMKQLEKSFCKGDVQVFFALDVQATAQDKNLLEIIANTLITNSVDTSAWKTYRNEKYGFEVKYPPEWSIEFDMAADPNTKLQKIFGVEFKGMKFNKRFMVTVYPQSRAINLKDWLSQFDLLANNVFLSPPDWAKIFSANAESVEFLQFDGGGASWYRVWAKEGIYIFDVGTFAENSEMFSTFKFLK